jgi:hypothetical protein
LNKDGAFYRIRLISGSHFICDRIAVSGTGGGSGGSSPSGGVIRPEIQFINKLGTTSLINGQDFTVFIKATSYLTAAGAPYDDFLTIHWELIDTSTGAVYKQDIFDIPHGEERPLALGEFLRHSASTKISVWAEGGNHDEISRKVGTTVSTSELYLALPSTFSSLKVYDDPS